MFQIFEYFLDPKISEFQICFYFKLLNVKNLEIWNILKCFKLFFPNYMKINENLKCFNFFLARFGRCFKFIFVSNFREFLDEPYLEIWNVSNCFFQTEWKNRKFEMFQFFSSALRALFQIYNCYKLLWQNRWNDTPKYPPPQKIACGAL